MNSTLVQFIVAVAAIVLIHLGMMTLLARAWGIAIRRVAYGFGPTLFTRGIFQVKAVPLGGHVKLKDSREESLGPDDLADAFDHQSVARQVLLPLVGNIALLSVAAIVLGLDGWSSFVRAFAQVFEGALSPFGAAQQYLQSFAEFTRTQPFVAVAALVATKFAAVNLLPFGGFNGAQVLLTLIRFGRPTLRYEESFTRWGIFLTLVLFLSWLVAGGYFGSSMQANRLYMDTPTSSRN